MEPIVINPPTRAKRVARGKAARKSMPLAQHAEVARAAGMDPVAVLHAQSVTRVPELVPVRYGRMLVTPFTFYRGAAATMASDLGAGPRTELTTQLCGDAHLSNFGIFASPERQVVFDLNDFDETHPGPFEWDVKRLAASLEIAGRNNGFSPQERRATVLEAARGYRTTMRWFAEQTNLAVWYSHQPLRPGAPIVQALRNKTARKALLKTLDKALSRDHLDSLRRFTENVDGKLRFISQPPVLVPARELVQSLGISDDWLLWINRLLGEYAETLTRDRRHLIQQYKVVDMARKVVGVGSVGTRAWILLLQGADEDDRLLLQAKEATNSVLEAHLGRSIHPNHGERVVQGQRLMQAYGDVLLGWHQPSALSARRPEVDYYVRQLRDWKGSAPVEALDPEAMAIYAYHCAWTLARAHARSGDRVAIATYLGGKDAFDNAIADFATAYAERNEADYAVFADAANEGRIPVMRGV